ncbi:HlyD family efflux transporter periplasmic adaptor subunit [Chitinophaga sp. XS-30]|nr:HlyD family efflux transporter periplasmic adaptor subunit [Chitinophaga sp. XS-30]
MEPVTESVYASGIVKSMGQYRVFATVSGVVQQVFVTEGDTVKTGTPILAISGETARLSGENARLAERFAAENASGEKLEELKAQIALAKSKMDNDALLLERQKRLWSQRIGSQHELEQRELASRNSATAYRSAVLQYGDLQRQLSFNARQSRKNLEISNSQVNDYLVRSGMEGRVYDVLPEPGELVTPQSPVALVGRADSFLVELQVDEYDIARLQVGQTVMLTMDSYRGSLFEAKITRINPVMHESSRAFTVDAAFISRPATLYPNLTVEANIMIRHKERAMTIPREYLAEGTYVILKNGERKKVVTGLKDYQKAEIISGLDTSDIILKPDR